MSDNQRGQVLPLVAVVIVFLAGSALLLGHLAEASTHRAQARTAADAAALAGAAGGEEAARRLATENGARLVAFTRRDGAVWVTVTHGPAQARATAERARTLITPAPDG